MLIRSVFTNSLIAAVLTGLLMSAIQQIEVIPLIYSAETLETQYTQYSHHHAGQAHPPKDPLTRTWQTLSANTVTTLGYALLMMSTMLGHELLSNRKKVTPASGVVWGLVGFWAFFASPALLVPPETPAYDLLLSHNQALSPRQLLWIAISASTVAGMALFFYAPKRKALAISLIAISPALSLWTATSTLSDRVHPIDLRLINHLEHSYVYATSLTNLLFWLFLGLTCATLTAKHRIRNRLTPRPSS